jgi:CheY-like chemotaxis protein
VALNPPQHPNGLSVLVVEDDDLQRRFLAALLDRAGVAQLYWANNGRTALEMFRRGPEVDVVVCDLLMPEMDGQTFLTTLHDEGYAPSIIIASGADSQTRHEMEAAAERLGLRVLGFLSKPVVLDALLTLLSRHTSPSVPTPPQG